MALTCWEAFWSPLSASSPADHCSPSPTPIPGIVRRLRPCLPQQLERMRRPVALRDSGDAPEHAERLDRPRRFDRAHILRVPAELVEDLGHDPLGLGIVAADEHGRTAAGEMRIDHLRIADRVERLDET